MDVPNLVRERLGDESVEATVSLGDEDLICVTPTRTILYRGEGLLSDESIEEYSHNVERLKLSEGRRNTKFQLEYVDGTETFKIPGDRTDTLLQMLLQGILRVAGVSESDESVAGVFRFSEMTLIVTDARLVKHIGTPVWDNDFEVYDYADVTDLDFEEGSVATQIVLTVDGRPERIKAPNEEARRLEQTVTKTLCNYYDVRSVEELRTQLDERTADEEGTDEGSTQSEQFQLEEGISPLVDDSDEEPAEVTPDRSPGQSESTATTATAEPETSSAQQSSTQTTQSAETTSTSDGQSETDSTGAESEAAGNLDAIGEQLGALTNAIKRQNELLRDHNERIEEHDEKIDQLIEELRRGR